METAVALRRAVTLLGRFPALAGVDLAVETGEVVLVRGPNGAGKSTLLRLCAGLLPLESGHATVLGHDLSQDRRTVRRQVGYLGHAAGLYDDLTVQDNVRFWARAGGVGVDDADRALELLGLDGRLASVAVARLSAGQRRRTAVAALVARRPELWLLDEPHAGLDQDARDLLDSLIRKAAEAGATIILASHELDRARGVADRSVLLAGGIVHTASAPEPVGGS